jgi:alpha-mannosidase
MATARVTLVAHTHWDREWYEPFEVFRARLLEVLDEALDLLEADPRLTFTLDGQVALVDDYLELRPGAEPRIRELARKGRLHVGPWYTAADTLLTDGEAVIRNLSRGLRRAEELGGAMKLGYMPDQFGHAAQIPQILRAFGIEAAAVWRGVGPERPPHAFRWIAPDGSEVTTLWLQDGYASGRRLPSDGEGFAQAVERSLERLQPWLGDVPLVLPVGDDHVRLAAWLPEAAETLRVRRPGLFVEMGSYTDHLPHLGELPCEVRGELRSPAFAPVLAGVASARANEKRAAARATALLTRYAEPIAAWAAATGAPPREQPLELIDRAWLHLIHNHAHDSAAGCGVDATHEDVKARARWAEQLAGAARDRALASLAFAPPPAPASFIAFHPGPAAETVCVEVDVPRALGDHVVARGPDGVWRPAQPLTQEDEQPLFEGEFAANELGMYLGGLDPATPLFGRYLTGITIHPDGPGRLRLDVGLGEAPVSPAKLQADQKRVGELLGEAERFRVVLHAGGTTRRAVVAAGPAPEAAFVPIALHPARPGEELADTACGSDGEGALRSGPVRVEMQPDGSLVVEDRTLGIAVRTNDLADEGDRGDLYHFDRANGAPVRPRAARSELLEAGPVRARLRVWQEFVLPVALKADRSGRAAETRATTAVTDVTVYAGERRVELTTTFHNEVLDHRLRALTHLPFSPTRLDADQAMAVVSRPLDPAALGAGLERPSPTGQHHGFVDASDGARGVALLTRGLPEHELISDGGPSLALTLLRGVGWLSRGDLACIDQAVGPMVPTPGAQELGPHRFDYALYLHAGDWREGAVLPESRRFGAPPFAFAPPQAGARRAVPLGRGLVELQPGPATMTALHPAEGGAGLIVRVLNASPEAATASLRCARAPASATAVDPLERALPGAPEPLLDGDRVTIALGPWQFATLLLR